MATKSTGRNPKRIENVCDRNYDGEHAFEIVNFGHFMQGSVSGGSVPSYSAFCRRCAKTVPVKSS